MSSLEEQLEDVNDRLERAKAEVKALEKEFGEVLDKRDKHRLEEFIKEAKQRFSLGEYTVLDFGASVSFVDKNDLHSTVFDTLLLRRLVDSAYFGIFKKTQVLKFRDTIEAYAWDSPYVHEEMLPDTTRVVLHNNTHGSVTLTQEEFAQLKEWVDANQD